MTIIYITQKGEGYLDKILFRHFGKMPPRVLKTSLGMPYFENNSSNISLSHSGDCVAVAISDKIIGIDIEQKKNRSLTAIAHRYFADDEREGEIDELLSLWTAKEAYSKYLGEKLSFTHLSTSIGKLKADGLSFASEYFNYIDSIYSFTICGELNVEFIII